jgi:glucokinase
MILAGDVGGTKTLLGLFEPAPVRPRPVAVRVFLTLEFADLVSMVERFVFEAEAAAASIEAASFGLAGPIVGDIATLTNVPWTVDAREMAAHFNLPAVSLLNDLEATAYGVPALRESETLVLQEGVAVPGGRIAVIAAGTGLGESSLYNVAGRYVPLPSEGGHADFAPRTEREIELLRDLTRRHGRACVEDVVSGPGFVHLYQLTHRTEVCAAAIDAASADAPMAISAAALERRCARCAEALSMFVEAYGAESGNLALRIVSTGGVFVAGGIAPKILPALTEGAFMRVFRDKAPFGPMLEAMPVRVVLNPQTALIGSSVHAAMTLASS